MSFEDEIDDWHLDQAMRRELTKPAVHFAQENGGKKAVLIGEDGIVTTGIIGRASGDDCVSLNFVIEEELRDVPATAIVKIDDVYIGHPDNFNGVSGAKISNLDAHKARTSAAAHVAEQNSTLDLLYS